MIAALALIGIVTHLVLRFALKASLNAQLLPLLITLIVGGLPQLYDLLRKLLRREFGSDLLGGVSIITSLLLGEYLAGSIIVLMLAGGEALESYALRSASSVLAALAKRMPSIAHRKAGADIADVALADIAVGDTLVIYPHEICPADGIVTEGRGVMDESYLTGEPFQITKTTGSAVIGAVDLGIAAKGGGHAMAAGVTLKSIAGGYLLQSRDNGRVAPREVKVLKYAKKGGQRPEVKTVRVLGNERLTAGGNIKRIQPKQKSLKKSQP